VYYCLWRDPHSLPRKRPLRHPASRPMKNKSSSLTFTKFKIGDTAPAQYQTPEYTIKQYQLRNLPAPDAGTHWTYMGENYVLIGDADGKIYKAYNGDIFYHR
jgi:Ni/Co efflux regulator RcnB